MPELDLKQPRFTYSTCGPFTRNKERIEKFMQTGNTDYIYRNQLDKACVQHDMNYGISKIWSKIWWFSKRISIDGLHDFS